MKKAKCFLCTLFILPIISCVGCKFKDDLLIFEYQEDNTFYVKGFQSYVTDREKKEIKIPSVHSKLPVTGIANGAFENEWKMEKVSIPDSVTYLGDEAFACTGITDITIGKNIEHIGIQCFGGSKIESIIYESSADIDKGAFASCLDLKDVNIKK